MQTHDRNEYVQTIDIAALHAMLNGATTQEVPLTPPEDRATQPVALVVGPTPPAALDPADSCYNDALDEMWFTRTSGNPYQRFKQWLHRDGNRMAMTFIMALVIAITVVAVGAIAVAAQLPQPTTTGYWLAVENNGTVDFLTGIPTTDGSFSGLWYSVPPGQASPTIAPINGYVKGGIVHITQRDGVQVAIVGRITGTGNHASIVFTFATFHASNWDAYKNALLNRGR